MNPRKKTVSKKSWPDKQMASSKDHLQRRCPRLGGTVEFSYCRCVGENGIPCWKVFDCWWEIFDVVAYFKGRLDKDTFDKIVNNRPKPKILSILELVEQTKARMNTDSSTSTEDLGANGFDTQTPKERHNR